MAPITITALDWGLGSSLRFMGSLLRLRIFCEVFCGKSESLASAHYLFFFLPDGESKALTRLVFTTAREVFDF